MGKYTDTPGWDDVIPIPQDDGGPNPLAMIAYTDAYSEAMSYLRAVMASDEKSERVLALTQDIIKMNPAHYTVWYLLAASLGSRQILMCFDRLYRVDNLFALEKNLLQELEWLNSIALKHLKNYQIWYRTEATDSDFH